VEALLPLKNSITLCGRDDRTGMLQGQILHGAGGWPVSIRKFAFAWQLLWLAGMQRPELVICTHLNYGPVALMAKLLFGTRYVLVGHGVEVDPGLSWLRRAAVRRACAVWAVSRWTRERARLLGVDTARISIVGNTVDSDRFCPQLGSAAVREAMAIPQDARVVLTVARLDPEERYKGCDAVLRTMPALSRALGSIHYVIVGLGDDQHRLRALARQLDVEDCVHFAGFVGGPELPGYYAAADVFAMPSRGEGFGIVFLESMACGTPVLGGNRDGTTDALDDGRLGMLVDPCDDDAVASGLQAMLEHKGADVWFQPTRLREACLARHGRPAFQARVSAALTRAGDD
jgi:glycosyltransferase involved in cell wall biosynthesis